MSYQESVVEWAEKCFEGDQEAMSFKQRAFRFAEEAIELCQAAGMKETELAVILVSVFDRKPGKVIEEVGGVMVTTALLCHAAGVPMNMCADAELMRISSPEKIARIRARRAAQQPGSPVVGD